MYKIFSGRIGYIIVFLAFLTGYNRVNAQHHTNSQSLYSCPMHPEVTSDEPEKCPKCGMKLEKTAHAGHHEEEH